VVFATRLLLGLAEPTGESTDLLPNKRFYAGGASSMRGFARRKLGPLDATGAPIGGEAKLEASVELRFPMFWRIQGTAFADAGQVWLTRNDVTADNIEVAVGPGLWFATPVGPIRTDLGYRLTYHDTSQSRWAFHFSIGPAF
jgi:outer membrane translocation and assembly module TamA